MKLCFVAKNEEEFRRYLKGVLPPEKVKQLEGKVLHDPIMLRKLAEAEYKIYHPQGEVKGWFSCCAVDDISQDYSVYVMLAKVDDSKYKDNIRDNLDVINDDDDTADKKGFPFLSAIECCMKSHMDDSRKVEFDNETFIFIHWGGGDPSRHEKLFQLFCDANPEAAKGLQAFALSSRRRELFNVTAPTISLQKTKEEAQVLVDGFSFDRVKDVMTEYVLHYFSIDQEKRSAILFVTEDKRIPQPLQGFLNSQARRLESGRRLSDIEKRCLQAIKQVLETVKWNEERLQIPYEEETVVLFSALIRGGGHV